MGILSSRAAGGRERAARSSHLKAAAPGLVTLACVPVVLFTLMSRAEGPPRDSGASFERLTRLQLWALPFRDGPESRAVRGVLQHALDERRETVRFHVTQLLRYQPAADRWVAVENSAPPVEFGPLPRRDGPQPAGRVIFVFPREIGLYWLQCEESGVVRDDRGTVTKNPRTESVGRLVASGGMLCEDLHLGPAPAGRVAACVPSVHSAAAAFVPIPPVLSTPERSSAIR